MAERGFSATIAEVSKEVSHKIKVQLADTTDAVAIEKATENGQELVIDVDYYAVLDIHNEHSNDKDYKNFIVVDKSGTKYKTGSQSFWNAFMDIWSEMKDDSEDWQLKVYQRESKNRPGKTFITCGII